MYKDRCIKMANGDIYARFWATDKEIEYYDISPNGKPRFVKKLDHYVNERRYGQFGGNCLYSVPVDDAPFTIKSHNTTSVLVFEEQDLDSAIDYTEAYYPDYPTQQNNGS